MVYVKVFLEDVNDNRPAFYPVEYAASISTQSMPGTAVLRVTAHDKDEGLHGKVTYHIVAGNSPPLFSLNKDTGKSCRAWPGGFGQPGQTPCSLVSCWLLPCGYPRDLALIPHMPLRSPRILPGSLHPCPVCRGCRVHGCRQSLPGPCFSLLPGVVSLSWSLSGKANTLVQLAISARDGGGLVAQPNAHVNISIVAGTVSPPVFEQAQYFFTVTEDTPQGTSVGAVRAQNPPGRTPRLLHRACVPAVRPAAKVGGAPAPLCPTECPRRAWV